MPPANAQEKDQDQETSIRDDFESAIAAVENDDEGAITVETRATENEQITAEDLNSDDGKETAEAKAKAKVEAEAGKAVEKAGSADGDTERSADTGKVADAPDDDNTGLDKAPESWPPTAREGWKDLPEPVRAQIAKREHEIDKTLNEGAQHRKTGAAFQGIADRYAQVIAAEGATDALTGVEELVRTVATLRMGSPQQKAEKVAGFIQHYGIDIGMLDDMLTKTMKGGEAAPEGVSDPVMQMLNDRLKPMDSWLAKQDENTRRQTFQANQDAINEVMTFKQTAEFYTDVQDDMADMVEMAQKRGVKMPLQEAYDKACSLNPQVSGVLAKRVADEKLLNNGKTLEEKRNASSSIAGKQSGEVVADTEKQTLRQTIEAGFNAQVG